MQRIFAVYCKVNLIQAPDWLPAFREKYDKPYDYHLTLKQSATIKLEQLEEIKTQIKNVLIKVSPPSHTLRLTFDDLVLDEHDDYDDKGWIYLFSKNQNLELETLQRKLRIALSEYSEFLNPASKEYEHNFSPHITIARELSPKAFEAAKKNLPIDIRCVGKIDEIILSCVREVTPQESTDPNNLTVFKL